MNLLQKSLPGLVRLGLALVILSTFILSIDQVEAKPTKEVSLKGKCEVPPTWGGTIPGDERFIPTFLDVDGSPRAFCDGQTGLVWEAEPEFTVDGWEWPQATAICINRVVGRTGQKGWRLPSVVEIASLLDENATTCEITEEDSICLPDGHPFENVRTDAYWSATTYAPNSLEAWGINMKNAAVSFATKTTPLQVWCVRGPMNADMY